MHRASNCCRNKCLTVLRNCNLFVGCHGYHVVTCYITKKIKWHSLLLWCLVQHNTGKWRLLRQMICSNSPFKWSGWGNVNLNLQVKCKNNMIILAIQLNFSANLCLIHKCRMINREKMHNIMNGGISLTNLRNCHLFGGCHGYHGSACNTTHYFKNITWH